MNGVNITLEQGAFLVKDNIYEFSDRFTNFLTNPHALFDGDIKENKIKRCLLDMRYDFRKGDKKSSR